MAGDSLIDQYVHAFAAHVRGRRDSADLVDEVDDHLRTSVERLIALGVDDDTAQHRALARFGEPRLVAVLITSVPSKGSIMSLFLSRHLGALAATAAVLWVVAAVTSYFGMADQVPGWTQQRYYVGMIAIMLACLVTTLALVGLDIRATGRFEGATAGILALGLAATVASLLAWFVGGWMPLLAAAAIWSFARAWRAHASSRPFTVAMLVVLPVLALAAIVASVVGVTGANGTEFVSWMLFAGVAGVIAAVLVDVAVRVGRSARHSEVAA